MEKSETRRDAEILVRNPCPRLFGIKFRDSKKVKTNRAKTWLRDLSKTLPRFRDPAKIFRDPRFSRYHSPPLIDDLFYGQIIVVLIHNGFLLPLFSVLRVGRLPRHWFISFSRLPFPASFAWTLNIPMVHCAMLSLAVAFSVLQTHLRWDA